MRINVTRSSMPEFEEYCQEIKSLWDSHWLTNNGEKHIALEEKLRAYLQSPEVELFTNGHLALEALLKAMALTGEVITTPFTFASTTHAIVRCGLTPVFCDVKEDGTLDPDQLEGLITKNTCAILPVHVYGTLCDVEAIQKIANRHSLPVVYDAAHAFGVKKDGISSACFGLASMYSFHATKVFNTIEGGAIATASTELAQKLGSGNFSTYELALRFVLGHPGVCCALSGMQNVEMVEQNAAVGALEVPMTEAQCIILLGKQYLDC